MKLNAFFFGNYMMRNTMKYNFFYLVLLVITALWSKPLRAQDDMLLPDKPGTFRITKNKLNGQDSDAYGKTFNFTDAEAAAASENLGSLIGIFRKTPVLSNIKGFDGVGLLNASSCFVKFGYGIPCEVVFCFQTWKLMDGKEVKFTGEPPYWQFDVNRFDMFCSHGFNETNYRDTYDATNPGFTPKKMDDAALALHELFFLPDIREELSPGIDRYGNTVVIYNPDRPPYWEQVTIREVFGLILDYWKVMPDKITSEIMIPVITKEFDHFSENEKDGFAYLSDKESITGIGSVKNETPVMRPNPAYWNKSLPRSAIQIMVLDIPPKDIVKSEMEEELHGQSGYYYVKKLLYQLDPNSLLPAIAR